jgi:hypothetical protein
MGLGHQVLALMFVAASTPFLLLNVVQFSRAKKVIEYLPFKKVMGIFQIQGNGSQFSPKIEILKKSAIKISIFSGNPIFIKF